jgi:Zn-dependent protease with chaperone function
MAFEQDLRLPEIGTIPDDSPNALTFGWSRRRAFLVISRGVLKYCDDEEVDAAAAHELDHLAHNDFVVMTLITAIVIMFFVVADWSFRMAGAASDSDDDEGNPLVAAVLVTGVVAYAMYLLAHLISLLVSRCREFWADQFSASATSRPYALAVALVKLAYGLAVEGVGLTRKKGGKHDARPANNPMIFDGRMARSLAVKADTPDGRLSKEAIKDTLA